ncbi:MAG: MMPL family transporter [Candidatus Thalassarchaeaceae archaeon]|nr:MMPL family transporter [Candidatus Thalassarchaeaceae archaeon]
MADFAVHNRTKFHVAIILFSIVMVPGFLQTLTPIDIESYDMDSPEMDAEKVINDEFSSKELTIGFVISIRDPSFIENGNQAPHTDSEGNPDRLALPSPNEVAPFQGVGEGFSGDGIPEGGVFNLTFLRELEQKVMVARADPLAEFYRPIVSELTGESANGTLSLFEQFEAFMANRSLLTRTSTDPFGNIVEPLTNWSDCGVLECLQFGDPNLTQAHIDLAANRMILARPSVFLRWTTTDRAFLSDPSSPVIGPVGGQIGEDGTFENAIWMPGRWSASSTWILLQLDKEEMMASGYTFVWTDARTEPASMTWNGLELYTTPPELTVEECRDSQESGNGPCSADWALLSLEHNIRVTDQESVTLIAPPTGINIEVNRELQQSVTLLATMFVCILMLLWASLRRVTDVAIVATTLGFSLLWMQGLIGWGMIIGSTIDVKIISRSQFSNLLPILILALGIDDSLHALHRYKEERNRGKTTDEAVHISLSRVGRAIMLTSLTTIAAFSANLTSSIPALRSFGIEAALGVASAFVLTGLWAPLIRYDIDIWMQKRNRLKEESEDQLYLVPKHWLSRISGGSAWASPFIIVIAIILTAIATPAMLSLEGDFKVEDFLDDESEFAQSVFIINERFSSEGEPALILIEGDVLNPDVYAAIGELRANMNEVGVDDPNRYTRLPTGEIELHAIDELVYWAMGSLATNSEPFTLAGWNESMPDNGVNCERLPMTGLPDVSSRGCLQFFYGFLTVYGIPPAGIIPEIPPSIPELYISAECELNPNATHLCMDGTNPTYNRMTMRWGLIKPEQFTITKQVLIELEHDLIPFSNLSSEDMSIRSSLDTASDEYPVTWAIPTGSPVTRYVAASSMQDELQGTLILGVYLCLITLWWGFRPSVNQSTAAFRRGKEEFALLATWGLLAGFAIGAAMSVIYGGIVGGICGFTIFILNFLWGERALAFAVITTFPILIVVVWLYGMIAVAGYGLNMVTVAIAAMSLGVGIDYVIHVVERYREERERGQSVHSSLVAMGGASGLALVGSAVSDVTGFAIISLSPMGFFAAFGLFCALMIALSFIASMVIASSVLGLIAWREIRAESNRAGGIRKLQIATEERLGIRRGVIDD